MATHGKSGELSPVVHTRAYIKRTREPQHARSWSVLLVKKLSRLIYISERQNGSQKSSYAAFVDPQSRLAWNALYVQAPLPAAPGATELR